MTPAKVNYLLNYSFIVILTFMLIYGFNLYAINSRYICCAILIALYTISAKYRIYVNSIFLSKNITWFLVATILYVILSIPISFVLQGYDLSFFNSTLGLIIVEFTCILLFSYTSIIVGQSEIITIIILSFVIQSLIIIFAFMFPPVFHFIRKFQYENIQEIANNYLNTDVLRGLALSGELFFGLAASFGLAIILCIRQYCYNFKLSYIFAAVFITISSFFVGRTSQVGAIFAIIMFFFMPIHKKIRKFLQFVALVVLSCYLAYFALPNQFKEIILNNILPYALQIFYNYFDNNSLSSSSTDELLRMLDIEIPFKTYLVGDGKFTDQFGAYYMHTDSGYMRQIFFGGILYLLSALILTIYMIFPFIIKSGKIIFRKAFYDKKEIISRIVILSYIFIIHIKGLTMMHCKEIFIMLMLYLLYTLKSEKYEKTDFFYSQKFI